MKTTSKETQIKDKLLRQVALQAIEKRGYPVKQETPVCPTCRVRINIMDPDVRVEFPEFQAGGKMFVLAKPTCPRCFTKVDPQVSVTQ